MISTDVLEDIKGRDVYAIVRTRSYRGRNDPVLRLVTDTLPSKPPTQENLDTQSKLTPEKAEAMKKQLLEEASENAIIDMINRIETT